jgi:predicted DsbA family dithiol-disulfide isomerase
MEVEVYADVVCPWCYIGARRLERTLRELPNGSEIERRWRPFQLRPEMPAGGMAWEEFARAKFGGMESDRTAFEQVAAAGEPDGVRFRFDRVVSAPNTVDAHRLILFAAGRGREWEAADALFRAYFEEGRDLNGPEHLAAAAGSAGLDRDEVLEYLAGPSGAREVEESQREARRLGIRGVPFYVVDGRYGIGGAQPVEALARALTRISARSTA